MKPKIWGKTAWDFLFFNVLEYPDKPTKKQKLRMRNFFNNLLVPCEDCQGHYEEYIVKYPLTDEVLLNKVSLGHWLCDLKNDIAKRVGKSCYTCQEMVEPLAQYINKMNSLIDGNKLTHEEVTPIEDLMREHGVLNRLLLCYEECVARLNKNIKLNPTVITIIAETIRLFVENYHEKTEENYIFPIILSKIKTPENNELINELLLQHKLGRTLTDKIIELTTNKLTEKTRRELICKIKLYIEMYRYHETREDTVVFQQLRDVISKEEYDNLGEALEKDEEIVLGKDGYERTLALVVKIEKKLGIWDLSKVSQKIMKK